MRTTPHRHIPAWALVHLDFLRGLAAALVLVNHVRGLFFVDYDQLGRGSAALKLLYLWTGMGHESVMVFFVLSGYFIGHSVIAAQRAQTWSWGPYLRRRMTRLYVVLIPGLLITALWDFSGMHLFGDLGIYAGKLEGAPYMSLPNVRDTSGPLNFLANLCFLQHLRTLPYGSNGPLWSLPYEFWYYLAFPMLVRAIASGVGILRRVLLVAAVATFFVLGGTPAIFYFVIWGLGALVALAWNRFDLRIRSRSAGLIVSGAAIGLFVAVLIMARIRFFRSIPTNELSLGVGTALLVLALLATAGDTAHEHRRNVVASIGSAYRRVSGVLARSSFTLYVVHYPALTFLFAWMHLRTRWQPDPQHLAIGAFITFCIAALYAYPIARVTEAHTDDVRKWLERRFRSRRPTTASS